MRIPLNRDKPDADLPQREPRRFTFIIHAEFTLPDEEVFSGWEDEDEFGEPIPRDFDASPLTIQEIVNEIKERYDSTLEMADTWNLEEHFTLEVHPVQPNRQQQARSA